MEAGGPTRNRSRMQYRRICFTLNNWTLAEYASLIQWTPTWLIIGKEVGEDGTPHLQGAAILGKQMDLSSIKKIPGMARTHIEPMMGTPEHSYVYCSKQDQAAFTFGTMPKPGKRNDLVNCYESLRAGATMRQLAEDHGVEVIKYSRGLMVTRSLLVEPRSDPPKIIWLCGPTGVGKTRSAVEIATEFYGADYWMSSGSLQWFDGYDGQRVAILDDLRGKHCSFSFFLRLLDRYSFRVPVKGASVEWVPEVIFITCPYAPKDLFSLLNRDTPENLEQLDRRITRVITIGKDVSCEFIKQSIRAQLLLTAAPVPKPKPPVIVIDLEDDNSDLEIYGDGPADEVSPSQVIEVLDSEDEGLSLESFLSKPSK